MTDKTIGIHVDDFFTHVGFKTGASLFSPLGIVQVPTKTVGPSKPTLSAMTAPTDSAGVLKATLVLPTTNTDGTALVRTELIKIALHYKDSPGVGTGDPAIEFPPVEELLWAPGDTTTHYVKIRVMDSHGIWSALSDDEKSAAAAAAVTPPEADGLWAHRLGFESVFTKDSPDPGKVAWANVILYWKDNKYEIDAGNTDKKYIWWDYSLSTTTFQTADDAPTLELEDVIVVYNDGGTPFMMVYSPMVLADYLRAGKIVSQSIELAVLADKGDVELRAGIAAGDFDNVGGAQGFIMGVDDSDDDKAKLYFGGPDVNNLMRFMKWTGSVLNVNADLVCTDDFLFAGLVSTRITYATASPGNVLDDMTTNSGLNYTGVVTRSYRIQIDNAATSPEKFKWSHDGGSTWEATGVAITGGAQTLEDNVKITFGATTGHNLNDYWDFTAGDTTTNIHHVAGVYKLFASTAMPADDTRIVLDGFGLGGGIDLYSGPAASSHVNLHAEGSISLDASGGV